MISPLTLGIVPFLLVSGILGSEFLRHPTPLVQVALSHHLYSCLGIIHMPSPALFARIPRQRIRIPMLPPKSVLKHGVIGVNNLSTCLADRLILTPMQPTHLLLLALHLGEHGAGANLTVVLVKVPLALFPPESKYRCAGESIFLALKRLVPWVCPFEVCTLGS